MTLRLEATIANKIEFSGICVHSGKDVNMTIHPAHSGTGIVFNRTDISGKKSLIKLSPNSVLDPVLCTRLVNDEGVSIAVVEHLLAALRIVGVSNVLIEIDSDEVPIMDGSADIFVRELKKAGIVSQESCVPAVVIKEQISVQHNSGSICVIPSNSQKINLTLSYDRIAPVIGDNNSYKFDMDGDLSKIAEARTFGWLEDYEKVKSMGLGKGSSEENTLVIMQDNSIKNKLRNDKELVMHKCLDLIGDISVIGYDIIGEIIGVNTSHALNNILMKKLLAEIDKHQIISEENDSLEYQNIGLVAC